MERPQVSPGNSPKNSFAQRSSSGAAALSRRCTYAAFFAVGLVTGCLLLAAAIVYTPRQSEQRQAVVLARPYAFVYTGSSLPYDPTASSPSSSPSSLASRWQALVGGSLSRSRLAAVLGSTGSGVQRHQHSWNEHQSILESLQVSWASDQAQGGRSGGGGSGGDSDALPRDDPLLGGLEEEADDEELLSLGAEV